MDTVIQKKAASLLNGNFNLGNKISEEKDAGYGGRMIEYENANIYSHSVMGENAHEIYGVLRDKYLSLGGHGKHPTTGQRLLGFPLSGVHYSIEAGVPHNTFEWGGIYSTHGCVYVRGRIFEYYKALDYDKSWLGLPIADPRVTASDERQYFEFGELWLDHSASKKIIELRWTTPQLGLPSIIKSTELSSLHMLTIRSMETRVSQYTAKILINGFKNKLFLKETGGTVEIPVELDGDKVKTYAIESPPGPNQDIHKFPFKISNNAVLKDNTLYDIIMKLPDGNIHTLAPHSLYIKNSWATCQIAHITDLHVARRYDSYRKALADKGFQIGAKRFNNFNDALRQFIKYANKLHEEGKLDFIMCTGDLVDYIFEDGGAVNLFVNATNNFKFLEEILRGLAPAPDQQVAMELKVPIFTTLGNHDYRVESYYMVSHVEIDWLPDYDKPQYWSHNLIHAEADALKKSVSSERALRMIVPDVGNKKNYLNYYFKHINRKESYEIPAGPNKIVMINGKWDSEYLKNVEDALKLKSGYGSEELKQFGTGSPNSIGFTDSEIELVKKALTTTTGAVIIGVHNPVVNTIDCCYSHHLRESLRKITPRAFEAEMKKFLFKKAKLKSGLVLTNGLIPMDGLMNAHKGWSLTTSSHFATGDGDDLLDFAIMRKSKKEFLKLCAGVDVPKPVNLVLSGHTHTNWECRITYNKAKEDFNFYADFYTDNPLKYYYEVDVDIDTKSKWAWPGATETKYEVEIGDMTEVVEVDGEIKKRADGSLVLKTNPNAETLNLTTSANKGKWWKIYAPLLIQTEALGPMNTQRGDGPHNPDFRGCRLISIKESIITEIHYVTKSEISQTVD